MGYAVLMPTSDRLYALVVFTIYTVNAVFFALPNPSLQATNALAALYDFSLSWLVQALITTLCSILPGLVCSRLILRLRLVGEEITSTGLGVSHKPKEVFVPDDRGGRPALSANTIVVHISQSRKVEADESAKGSPGSRAPARSGSSGSLSPGLEEARVPERRTSSDLRWADA